MGEHLSNVVKVLDGSLGFGKKGRGQKEKGMEGIILFGKKMTQVHHSYLMDKKF